MAATQSSSSSSTSLYGGKTYSQFLAQVRADAFRAADSAPRKPQSFRDEIVQARVHRERDAFIASIKDEDICRLASVYHNHDSCVLFKPAVRGSYNICYFVEFPNGDKWVVRVPINPTLALDAADKLESEVAAMRLVATRTTIPVPEIYVFALGDGPAPFFSFLILEYVEGQKLNYADVKKLNDEQRGRLYLSLADIHIQLRRLEFPAIGRLAMQDRGLVQVGKRVTTLDTNMQQLENGTVAEVINTYHGNDDVLFSAGRYVELLLDLADNAFRKGRGTASDEEEAADYLYHLHLFRQHTENWVDHSLDQGPFVLVHGDLEIFNLVLDDEMNIISVLDWEWSRVVPLQLYHPPLWLSSVPFESLCYGYRYSQYLERFDEFLAVLRVREREKYGSGLLADEWDNRKEKSGFAVAYALEHWTAMDWFAHRYIGLRVPGGREGLRERVEAFMRSDPGRKQLAKQKALDWLLYKVELDDAESASVGYPDQGLAAMSQPEQGPVAMPQPEQDLTLATLPWVAIRVGRDSDVSDVSLDKKGGFDER